MHILSTSISSGKEDRPVRCPHCATTLLIRYGGYLRAHPHDQRQIRVQRYLCKSSACSGKTFSILPCFFLPIVRHFHRTLFLLHVLLHEEGKTQSDTARLLGLTRGVVKRLGLFNRRFLPWFHREKHIGEWGPDPAADSGRYWMEYTREFSQSLYPKRWAMD